jgi:hypothetical protein
MIFRFHLLISRDRSGLDAKMRHNILQSGIRVAHSFTASAESGPSQTRLH